MQMFLTRSLALSLLAIFLATNAAAARKDARRSPGRGPFADVPPSSWGMTHIYLPEAKRPGRQFSWLSEQGKVANYALSTLRMDKTYRRRRYEATVVVEYTLNRMRELLGVAATPGLGLPRWQSGNPIAPHWSGAGVERAWRQGLRVRDVVTIRSLARAYGRELRNLGTDTNKLTPSLNILVYRLRKVERRLARESVGR